MKAKISLLLLTVWLWSNKVISDSDLNYDFYGVNENFLNEHDKKNLDKLNELGKKGYSNNDNTKGHVLKEGEIVFDFNAYTPTIVCSLMQLCDLSLEAGEKVNSVQIGDSSRWHLDAATSGSAKGDIQHLIIKPLDTNLKTSLVIATNRRTYHINLKSSENDYMPSIRFNYPFDSSNLINKSSIPYDDVNNNNNNNIDKKSTKNSLYDRENSLDDFTGLDFNFDLNGNDFLIPERVYTDGIKTYIEMSPNFLKSNRMPAVFIVDEEHTFSEDRLNLTNYRVIKNRFIISGVYRHIRLKLGDNDNYMVDIIHNN